MLTGRKALIVEDEFLIADLLAELIGDLGMNVCGIVDTGERAVAAAAEYHPDIILMDVRLKGKMDGVDAARAIQRDGGGCPVIFLTGSREPATVNRISEHHPAATLFKPIDQPLLRRTLENMLN